MPHDREKTSELMEEIEALFEEKFGEDAGIAICFTLREEGWEEVHWATNLRRRDGVKLFSKTATKMIAQTN